ncbi:tpr repeat protein [Rutstroemia sp. NJR-2017a WRK4]|nr:tpr repeat protein [Rutstroemia sp. NJR-2017a WRK4]
MADHFRSDPIAESSISKTTQVMDIFSSRGPVIQKLMKDELNFNKAITLLYTFGLIVFVLNKEWDKSLAHLALSCIALKLLQYTTRQANFIVDTKVDIDRLYWGFDNLGALYRDQGKLAEAEALYLRALEGSKKVLGLDHISTLSIANNLGYIYSIQGKLVEAEAIYLRALEGCEKALGPDYILTLQTVRNLGMLYSRQGKLAEIEAMYFRALEGFKKALGSDYISILGMINNLSTLYKDQGKLAETEVIYLRILESNEKALGPDYISTLQTVNTLDNFYKDQGKLAEVEAIYIRVLQVEDRLQALQVASAESDIGQIEAYYTIGRFWPSCWSVLIGYYILYTCQDLRIVAK